MDSLNCLQIHQGLNQEQQEDLSPTLSLDERFSSEGNTEDSEEAKVSKVSHMQVEEMQKKQGEAESDNQDKAVEQELLLNKGHQVNKVSNCCGNGKLTFSDGSIFEGEMMNNKANGYGTCNYTNGDIYEGEWLDNKKDGYGIFYNHKD